MRFSMLAFPLQQIGFHHPVIVVGDVGEGRTALHVAQGIDPRDVRLQPMVHSNETFSVPLDSCGLELEPVGVRSLSGCDQERRGQELPLPLGSRDLHPDGPLSVPGRAHRLGREKDVDSVLAEDAGELGRHVLVFAGQDLRSALDHGDPGSEPPEHLSKLEADVAAAEHH